MTAADGAESLGSKSLKTESAYAHKRAEHKDKAQSSQKFLSEHFRILHDIEKLYINPFGITLGELCLDLSAEQQSPIFGGLAAGVIGQAVEFA